jgi:Polyketide cyclase / dehydrase and lipid transport
MAQFTIRKHVEALREEAFVIASDFRNAAKNIGGIEELEVLTDGPIGVGTRFRETRVMFGKRSTEELEITEFNPPEGYTVEGDSCGAHFRAEYRFISDIAGTHIRVTFDFRPVTLMAKLMSPLALLMAGPMKKCIDADLEDLKTAAEAAARPIEHV